MKFAIGVGESAVGKDLRFAFETAVREAIIHFECQTYAGFHAIVMLELHFVPFIS